MATKNTKVASPKSVKPKAGIKKAASAKAVANKNVKTKPKKAAAKPVAKKTAKPVAKKAATKKPAAKAVPAKKAKPIVKSAKNNNQKTVNKKKPAPIAKKAAPVKKKEAPKKAAPVKKAAPAAKKGKVTKPAAKPTVKTPAKPVAKAPVKPAAKTPAKPVAKTTEKAAAAAKKTAPVATPPPAAVNGSKKPSSKKKTLTITQLPVKAVPGAPRPMATPAARPTEKKPTVIIAHRKMENKAKAGKNEGNTMIQYQPETYRSILDEPQEQQGPAYRYSDEDLNEFREIITSRLEAARKELSYLQGLITRKDEAGTEDTENRYMNMEDGSGAMEREQLAQLASRQIQFMGHLEKALVRIENKTYGICRVTGKLIDKARLRAVPHATLSIEAKKMMASKQN